MRILRLYIANHLILRDLDLRFDRPGRLSTGQYALDFLVGVNGSGKSTVLRTLTHIIVDLYGDQTIDFNYTLVFTLQKNESHLHVTIEHRGSRPVMTVRQDTESGATVYESGPVDLNYLPSRVVVHTTGNESSWLSLLPHLALIEGLSSAPEVILSDVRQRAIQELPGHLPRQEIAEASLELSPFLLIRESRLPLATLCGLLADRAVEETPSQTVKLDSIESVDKSQDCDADKTRPLKGVLCELKLEGLAGFSLRFRLHSRLSDYEAFERLRPRATRYVRQGNDHLLVFDLPDDANDGRDAAAAILSAFENALGLFDALEKLQEPSLSGEPTLQQVNLFLQRKPPQPGEGDEENPEDEMSRLLLLEWLSDGERSFLGRMALLAMLDTDESLILLDEPEVHFNDYWKREIVKLLDTVMQRHSNHLLIVSHSSIALSDVTESQVMVLRRSSGGYTTVQSPSLKTFGTDPSEIMVVLFRTDLSVGALASQLLESAVTTGDQAQLQDFLNRVGPGMWRFRLRQRLEALNAPSA